MDTSSSSDDVTLSIQFSFPPKQDRGKQALEAPLSSSSTRDLSNTTSSSKPPLLADSNFPSTHFDHQHALPSEATFLTKTTQSKEEVNTCSNGLQASSSQEKDFARFRDLECLEALPEGFEKEAIDDLMKVTIPLNVSKKRRREIWELYNYSTQSDSENEGNEYSNELFEVNTITLPDNDGADSDTDSVVPLVIPPLREPLSSTDDELAENEDDELVEKDLMYSDFNSSLYLQSRDIKYVDSDSDSDSEARMNFVPLTQSTKEKVPSDSCKNVLEEFEVAVVESSKYWHFNFLLKSQVTSIDEVPSISSKLPLEKLKCKGFGLESVRYIATLETVCSFLMSEHPPVLEYEQEGYLKFNKSVTLEEIKTLLDSNNFKYKFLACDAIEYLTCYDGHETGDHKDDEHATIASTALTERNPNGIPTLCLACYATRHPTHTKFYQIIF